MLRLVLALCAALAPFLAQPARAQDRDVKFILDFIALGRHAPWYVAVGKGFYKEEGLNVSILPSKGTADAIRGVQTGLAEFGFVDVPSLVAAGAAAKDVKIVAGAYQRAPYCIFTLSPGANITEPKQLAGIELGSSTASFVPAIWRAFMKLNGLDPSTLKVVNIDGSARVPMLVAGKVQAIDLFIMAEPGIRRAAPDKKANCLLAADYGLDIYANSIGVTENLLRSDPELVRKFVRASMKGWQHTFANPDEATQLTVAQVKALNPEIVREEIEILKRIALNDAVRTHGFGHIDPAKMKATVDFMNANVEVSGEKLTAEDIFRPGFLPSTPIRP